MQNAKDSFYIALRDRLATINPARIMTLRAVGRPSILVEESESPASQIPNDIFVVRWTAASYDDQLPLILVKLTCEIVYATSGSSMNGGLDRGRALSEMDEELLAMASPMSTPKVNYATSPAQELETLVFWSTPVMGRAETLRNRLTRTTQVTVFAFEEQGE